MDFLTLGFWAGVACGCVVGYAFALARGAWKGYKTTKAAMPGMRKAAWVLTGALATRAGLVLVLGAAAVVAAVMDR